VGYFRDAPYGAECRGRQICADPKICATPRRHRRSADRDPRLPASVRKRSSGGDPSRTDNCRFLVRRAAQARLRAARNDKIRARLRHDKTAPRNSRERRLKPRPS